mmetsp:Transcript_27886/g.70273  ORF Transcript_27886/g.70273 Transcript_27886/m.70273 type:complete len:213 (-) Transcript_27886:646-1284(-)
MIFFISPSFYNSFLKKPQKNNIKFSTLKKDTQNEKKFFIFLKMKKNNSNNLEEIQKYQKFLPHSFLNDSTAPFAFSFMWLQRIGRLDLNENFNYDKKKREKKSTFQINFKSDPMFRIYKKTKKEKKEKFFSPISVGKNKEEKMILFDYNKKKKINKSFKLNSYSKKYFEKKKEFKLTNLFSIISIQNNKATDPTKLAISFFLSILAFFIFYF